MRLKPAFPFIALAMGIMASCGEEPGMYKDEIITFTTPVSAKMEQKTVKEKNDLNLREDESSNFCFTRFGALIPWGPTPIFDYYNQPLPLEVPVSPFFSLIEFVHPFYAPYFLDNGDDDQQWW